MAEDAEKEKSSPGSPADSARRVFISYASHDAPSAQDLCLALEAAGLPCWMAPRDVKAGALYADAIVRAISSARAFVLVLSEHAINSSHVGKEIERASSKRCPVIALRIDAAPLTPALEYFLSESQWVEAQVGNNKAAYARLIDAIREFGQPAPGGVPGVPSGSSVKARGVLPQSRRKWILIVASLAALAVVALFAGGFWLSKHPMTEQPGPRKSATSAVAPTISEKSIAVLPFMDMSEKKDQEYFSDGLSEDLITALSQFPGLKVIGRTSSFNFRDSKDDSKTIGTKLGVAHLLEGSVRHAGDMVRVSAELIDASDGSTQWSERYDRPYKDLFGLQDDLTRAVGGALKAHLMPRENASVQQTDRPPSGNLEAYNIVLEGKYYLARDTDADTRKAIELFTRATQLDPRYAFAWSSYRALGQTSGDIMSRLRNRQRYFRMLVRPSIPLFRSRRTWRVHTSRGVGCLIWGISTGAVRKRSIVALSSWLPGSGDAAASLARQLANFGQWTGQSN